MATRRSKWGRSQESWEDDCVYGCDCDDGDHELVEFVPEQVRIAYTFSYAFIEALKAHGASSMDITLILTDYYSTNSIVSRAALFALRFARHRRTGRWR